jgi:indole-3-glycerol phosphate synthase / phosphoribosylanthranilate isomerase
MSAILDKIVAEVREEMNLPHYATQLAQYEELLRSFTGEAHDLFRHFSNPSGEHFIFEIKPKSPSLGPLLRSDFDINHVVRLYATYGVGISVLTNTAHFGGSFELLHHVNELVRVPTLCKDFILNRLQLVKARLAGAKWVLLIIKILSDEELSDLAYQARELGMVPLIEIQNETELARALGIAQPQMILINNRNLSTFEIDFQTTHRLAPLIPSDIICISASGIRSRQDIEDLLPVCQNFLVGSHLMQAPCLESELIELCGGKPFAG